MNIEFGEAVSDSPNTLDNKIVKKIWPKTNNESNLDFVFNRDPNLALVKNNIAIHFVFNIDEKYTPDVAFAAKLFRMLHVEGDSQLVSSNKSQYVYYDYIEHHTNICV